jgi:Ca2+-binding EF-hand superfamily protein
MTRILLVLGLVIGVTVVAQVVLAQRPGRGGPPGGAALPSPLITALDADRDGELSAKEIDNAPAALRTLDKDKDGKLSRGEFMPAPRERGPAGAGTDELVARLLAFDKNGDGKLSANELPERMQGLLARADANKDGFVDKEELTKLAQQQAAARRDGAGPGMGRGGLGPGDGRREPDE